MTTRTQLAYLRTMEQHGHLTCGWGGMSSTLTVRILAERGLCTLAEYGPGDWRAQITAAGRLAIGATTPDENFGIQA